MTTPYSATLHDKTAKTQTPAIVYLDNGRLRIEIPGRWLDWQPAELHSTRLLDDGSVILQHGAHFLEVMDPAFAKALELHNGKQIFGRRSFFDKIGVAGCLLAAVLLLAPLVAAYIWLLPFLADKASGKISPELEKQVGDSWYQSLTATYTIDQTRSELVQQFYDSLHFGGQYPMKITVVREPVINAFAVPGGHIVVFDSIIGIMDAPEQLAALLAHEASHVQLRHSTRAIFRELASHLFLGTVFGSYGDLSGLIAQHGDELAGLSYSRNLEMEADSNGLKLMQKSGIPLRGMPALFRKMQHSAGQSGGSAPTFLSTHPVLDERIQTTEAQIARSAGDEQAIHPALLQLWVQLKTGQTPH